MKTRPPKHLGILATKQVKSNPTPKALAPKSAKDDPNWSLGPLLKVDPKLLLSEESNDLEEFMLALALIFNDLKTAILLKDDLMKQWPGGDVTPQVGQRSGLTVHLTRLSVGTIHEMLELLKRQRAVLDLPDFKAMKDKIPQKPARMFDSLVMHSDGKTPEAKVLLLIRNNAAFHHYQPKELANGYRAWFKNAPTAEHGHAYVSQGPHMDATRFYYADAAALQVLQISTTRSGVNDFDATMKEPIQAP